MYELESGKYCLRDNQCHSGFCYGGKCLDPKMEHQPCRPEADLCPYSLTCSTYSRTCVSSHHWIRNPCKSGGDCSHSEACERGICIKLKKAGEECILRDRCEMGYNCKAINNNRPSSLKCLELCNKKVPCSKGYTCSPEYFCIPTANDTANPLQFLDNLKIITVGVLVLIGLLGIIYGWIRLTKTTQDPRLKKKKKLRLNYEGNGLATITVIPSQSQSPVVASQLFINNTTTDNGNLPPSYDEIVILR